MCENCGRRSPSLQTSKLMASLSFSRTILHTHHYNHNNNHHHNPPSSLHFCSSNLSPPSHSSSFVSSLSSNSFNQLRYSPIRLHPPLSGTPSYPSRSIGWCRSGSANPPPSPPERPDPGPGNQPVRSTGIAFSLSRIWDSIQIFFAVLFWMALFFWASAWDGRNTGRRTRGGRFRR